ncbi:MAG: hypothetical protein O2985_17960 [Proteobacteria bacterium]|nr:hypothetical protein [Pseudomonadota bacterium]
MAEAYLEHIHIFVRSRDSELRNLRTFLDNWFQYDKGKPFLNNNCRPIWFNKPDPVKYKDALLRMHFVSEDARRVIDGGLQEHLVKDHAVPVKVIGKILMDDKTITSASLQERLCTIYRLGVITKSEDLKLNAAGLRQKMPSDWRIGDDVFARYVRVGIVSHSNESC